MEGAAGPPEASQSWKSHALPPSVALRPQLVPAPPFPEILLKGFSLLLCSILHLLILISSKHHTCQAPISLRKLLPVPFVQRFIPDSLSCDSRLSNLMPSTPTTHTPSMGPFL